MSRADGEARIAASLAWANVDEPDPEDLARALRWTWLVWTSGLDRVPPLFVHDLGFTLWRGRGVRYASARRPEAERARRLRAEDRMLAPWLLDPVVHAAHVAIGGETGEDLDRAVAHAVSLAAPRALGDLDLPPGPVAALRGLAERWAGLDRAGLVEKAGPALVDAAAELDAVVERVAGQPLLREEDVWELGHLRRIPSESARVALRTLHRTERRIGPPRPELIAALRRRAREVPTDESAADVYPTGGFDAMATRGALENLVRSEVGYVGEVVADPLDLFDVRYLEGELLYYTRDDSPLLEPRRHLRFVVEVDELDSKVRELPTQTLVLCLAIVARVHRDLLEATGPLAVFTSLTLVGPDPELLQHAAGMMETSWAADLAHHRARIGAGPVDPEADDRRIVLSARPAGPPARVWIQVGQRTFLAHEIERAGAKRVRTSVAEVDAADPAQLRALVDRLLAL
jgi:hypothetical protein